MIAALLPLLLSSSTPIIQQDTGTFQDPATRSLIEHARARHLRQDSLIHDYRATIHTRLEMTAGRNRFTRNVPLVSYEAVARIGWQVPNDLSISVLGSRNAVPILRLLGALGVRAETDAGEDIERDLKDEVWLDRPWFVPRALSDSVRLMGVPDLAALHPLAAGATDYYRYAITDSVVVASSGRTIRAVAVHVEPKRNGPSLVAGDMWLDADSGDLVRLRVLFLGQYLWNQPGPNPRDSSRARHESRTTARYITAEADLEYALHEDRFWMPYRQGVLVTLRAPLLIDATVPIRAVTTFADYAINTGGTLAFRIPADSLPAGRRRHQSVRLCPRCRWADATEGHPWRDAGYARGGWTGQGGRWEIDVPPRDSLEKYQWPDDLAPRLDAADEHWLRETGADLARLSEQLPSDWVGRQRYGVAWERFADLFRFNRVQGASLGLGYEVRPGLPFTSVLATTRFGLSDHRPTGSLSYRWDGPEGRAEVSAYRSMAEVEPWNGGSGISNSLNAVFAGHDEVDYYLATGFAVAFAGNAGWWRDVRWRLAIEQEGNVSTAATSAINDLLGGDGALRANPPITAGDFLRLSADQRLALGPVQLREAGDLLVGEGLATARAWVRGIARLRVLGRGVALGATAGAAAGDSLPQTAFRVGGPLTVRGYPYGFRQGTAFWAARADVNVRPYGLFMPVLFADLGDVIPSRRPLVGAGAGLSILGGVLRFDVSKGLNPALPVRFDLSMRLPG